MNIAESSKEAGYGEADLGERGLQHSGSATFRQNSRQHIQ